MHLFYLLRRVGGALLALALASILAASLVQLVPGDAADVVAGPDASAEEVAALRERLGTDRPAVEQYTSWVGDAVQGRFGESLVDGRDVFGSLIRAAPVTLTVAGYALVIAILLGFFVGVGGGLKPGSWRDRIGLAVATMGLSTPPFWFGLLLVSALALDNTLFPATGYVPLGESAVDWWRHATLPAVTLSFALSAELIRQVRASVIEVMDQPFIRTARSKGMSQWWLVRHHVLRNAAVPVVTVLGLQIGRLLGGAVVVEVVFNLPGLGSLAVNAVLRRDFPVLQAYVLMAATIVVVVNLLVDLSYGWLNPKVRAA